jgi:hypothetical protein
LAAADLILADAQARAAANPSTFQIPSLADRSQLEVGDFAKLIFLDTRGAGERMWVQIVAVSATGEIRYRGILANDPIAGVSVQRSAVIEFVARHICAIHRAGDPW